MSDDSAAGFGLAEESSRSDAGGLRTHFPLPPPRRCSLSDEAAFVARMLDLEAQYMPHPDYLGLCDNRGVQMTSRQDSINSILKVHAHFQFKPVTAFLSINYFDRFLSAYTLPETGWPFQLLSMTCLSLAAKMEELYVPCLLDLQMLETAYVFEPKTIQRMELLVLTTLKWRLRSVTPFDYLHHFLTKLPSSSSSCSSSSKSYSDSSHRSLASDIILNTARVIDFLKFPPSVIAAAAVISAAGAGEDINLLDAIDGRVDREMVRSCHQLMEEYLLDTCPSEGLKVMSIEPLAPPSPSGVLDAATCASCDTHSENPATTLPGSGDSQPENKRRRLSSPPSPPPP
ncbi:cyclin-D4-1-like [Andrographis paniculata]|uniref:cyclin-D4-1-like n=1 Tax=Andrographis paniculata TaxID=175694 RepID=UPI0021E98676|nr:cyclin-D4-1-like [Andrographis paniculata]XP_051146441.1 cyclin-D4-1-like [Andrographis paniculata]XP_051146442.1 cyclin-D4-1-like [Andrographis paniculata]